MEANSSMYKILSEIEWIETELNKYIPSENYFTPLDEILERIKELKS